MTTTPTWDLKDERRLLALACQESFETFARVCIGVTHPDNKKGIWWSDEVHRPLCHWFQEQTEDWLAHRHEQPGRKYMAVLIPRACAKSLLITRIGMLWLHLKDPNLSTYIGNEKLSLAESFLTTIKQWLEGVEDDFCIFNWLYGAWRGENRRWRSEDITHAARSMDRAEASFGIWSPNSALTGYHPDILCMDDLVSYDALKKDLNWFETAYSHMTDLVPVVEPNGLVILVGTRYSDADPFGRSFKNAGIATIAGHTDYLEYQPTPRTGRWHVYFLSGRHRDGTPAIPSVWSESEMRAYELQDPIKFASQVLNRPRAHKLISLTEAQFNEHIVDDLPDLSCITFHMDTAFKSQRKLAGGSETALVVIGHHKLDGHMTVLNTIAGITFQAQTFAETILQEYKIWSSVAPVMAITDELEIHGKAGTWKQYLEDRFTEEDLEMPTFYAFQRQQGERKDIRISDAINFIPRGQVHFYSRNEGLDALRYQLVNHPQAFPKDVADAFADGFQPEFFSGLLPKLKTVVTEKYPYGAFERRLKPNWSHNDDTLDGMDPDRPPLRRGATTLDASSEDPFAERGWAPTSRLSPR